MLHRKKDKCNAANPKAMKAIIDYVHYWWNAIDQSSISILYVLIRPNPDKWHSYDILLDPKYNADSSLFWTLPNEITDRSRDSRFEWIHLANVSSEYRYITYAAVKIVRTAAEKSEIRQHISPRGKWRNIQALIEGAKNENPLYGQRIRGYVKGPILKYLDREYPAITEASSSAVAPLTAVPAVFPKPNGDSSKASSFIVLIQQLSGRAYGEEYEVCMCREGENRNLTLPVIEKAMLNGGVWDWIVLNDKYASSAALAIFSNFHAAPEVIVPQLNRYQGQLEWHNLKSFYHGAIGGNALYGRSISHHLTTSIMEHFRENHPDLYERLTYNPAVSDIGHMPMYGDI
jgi:hypothetical protein